MLGVAVASLVSPRTASAHAPDLYAGAGVGTLLAFAVLTALGVIILRRHADYPNLSAPTVVVGVAIIVVVSGATALAMGVGAVWVSGAFAHG